MDKKWSTATISKRLIKQIENSNKNIEDMLAEAINEIELNERCQYKYKIYEKTSKKIKEMKAQTGQPKWKIIEKILTKYFTTKAMQNQQERVSKHIEPEYCEKCGSSDLLIQHHDYTWYCNKCGESGKY